MENEITPRLHTTPQNATLNLYQPRDEEDTNHIPKQGNTSAPSADDYSTPTPSQGLYLNTLAPSADDDLTLNQGSCLDTLAPLECHTLYFRRANGTVGKRSIPV
jgi:hypothetical protein